MKKIYWILIFLPALILNSCKDKNEYILSEEEFIDVLVDIHIADAFNTSHLSGSVQLSKIDSATYYKVIFEKHHIEKARFDSTLKTYTMQPELMESVYDKVIDKLQKMEAQTIKEEEKALKETKK